MNPSIKPRAITRTWAITLIFRECSVVTGSADYIVTLIRTADGLVAEVDGQPETLYRAVQMLEAAEKTVVLSEVLEPTPIGKARASRLHRLLGRLGLASAQHYALAAAALGEWRPLPSLAALTEREARTVWGHVCRLYPQARSTAA
jgi:hypothetical protein